MVIQKTKNFFFFNHICIIITFIYLSKSIIKSCINNPLNTSTLYSLSNLSSLYSRLKKRRMKRFLMRSFAYWGILAVKAANRISKRLSWRWHATICFAWILYLSTRFNRGNPPPSLSIQYEGSASHWGQSPINGSSDEG